MFVVCVFTLLQLSYTLACPHLNKIDNLCFLVVWGIIGVCLPLPNSHPVSAFETTSANAMLNAYLFC